MIVHSAISKNVTKHGWWRSNFPIQNPVKQKSKTNLIKLFSLGISLIQVYKYTLLVPITKYRIRITEYRYVLVEN